MFIILHLTKQRPAPKWPKKNNLAIVRRFEIRQIFIFFGITSSVRQIQMSKKPGNTYPSSTTFP